jgi:DNA-binding NarL/FixJ family response regulator
MAANVQDALTQVESTHPDLVITDLTLPGRSGMDLITELAASHPAIPVLVLSMHIAPGRLLDAVRHVLGGGVFTSQSIASHQ